MIRLLKYRTRIFILIMIACIFCVGLVWLNAQSSKLQYEINSINNKITETGWEIRDLEVTVKSRTNITNLEDKAMDLGMVFPTYRDIVYLRGDTPRVQDFALALRENVYR